MAPFGVREIDGHAIFFGEMPAVLEKLETQRKEAYAELVSEEANCLHAEKAVATLEGRMEALYRFAVQASREDISVKEVFDIWDTVVQICDSFIEHVRNLDRKSVCGISFDRLLDLRNAADDKRKFHFC